jgi:hypothetical protein
MPAWAWALVAVGAVALIAVALWQALARRRTSRLRGRFGSEYDRVVESSESRRNAEAELAAREERRSRLEIKPLAEAARVRYIERWQLVQAEFVDNPATAVATADRLIQNVMADRGYPVEEFEQRAADISVDHPDVVEDYREGHRLAHSGDGAAKTENLRQAMRHYRALFDNLVEPDADAALERDTTADAHESERVA